MTSHSFYSLAKVVYACRMPVTCTYVCLDRMTTSGWGLPGITDRICDKTLETVVVMVRINTPRWILYR